MQSSRYRHLGEQDGDDSTIPLNTLPRLQPLVLPESATHAVSLGSVSPLTSTHSSTPLGSTDHIRLPYSSIVISRPTAADSVHVAKPISKPGCWDTFSRNISDTWLVEIANLFASLAALAALTALLLVYSGKQLAGWQNTIGLNTVVSGFATIFSFCLMQSMSSAIGQMRWVRFGERGGTLEEFELFDSATRGPWGGISLVIKGRGGYTTSFGILVGLIALAIGPFVQEVISTNVQPVQLDSGDALVPRSLMVFNGLIDMTTGTTGVSANQLVGFQFEAAANNALYGGITIGSTSSKLATCSTGNCTYSPFNTLAVCGSCNNVTNQIQYDADDSSYTVNGVRLNGARLDGGNRVAQWNSTVNQTIDATTGNASLAHFTAIQRLGSNTMCFSPYSGSLPPQALECFLTYCVQTIQPIVVNGVLKETILANQTAWKTTLDLNSVFEEAGGIPSQTGDGTETERDTVHSGNTLKATTSPTSPGPFINSSESISATDDTPFMVDPNTLGAQRAWLTGLFTALAYTDEDEDAFYQGESSDCQSCQALCLFGIGNLSSTINAMAQSLTEQLRLSQPSYLDDEYNYNLTDTVAGVANHMVIITNVNWKWLILPFAVEVCGVLFVIAAIVSSNRTRTKLWKTSTLPVLFHGLDEEIKREVSAKLTMHEMEKMAEKISVRLGVLESGGDLILRRR